MLEFPVVLSGTLTIDILKLGSRRPGCEVGKWLNHLKAVVCNVVGLSPKGNLVMPRHTPKYPGF